MRGPCRILTILAALVVGLAGEAQAHDIDDLLREESVLERQRAAFADSDLPSQRKSALFGTVLKTYLWTRPKLRVCFGPQAQFQDKALLDRVARVADVWLAEAPIKFDFGRPEFFACDGTRTYEIRVSLQPQTTARFWSLPGNDALTKAGEPGYESFSMLLGFPADRSDFHWDDYVFNFYVLHEFGHALAFLHEHQAKDCKFDEDYLVAVLKYDRQFVQKHLAFLKRFDLSAYPWQGAIRESGEAIGTKYDKDSVMQYWFKNASVFKEKEASVCWRKDWVDRLSAQDKLAVREAYRRIRESLRLSLAALGPSASRSAEQRARDVLGEQALNIVANPTIDPIPPGAGPALLGTATGDVGDAELQLLRKVLLMRFE